VAGAEAPTFRTSTQLVQVDVIVKGKDTAVKGLSQDAFELYDNGQRQQIAVFSIREQGSVRTPAAKLALGVRSNFPVSLGPEPVSATVILLDSQNTAVEAQMNARIQALKYIDKAGRQEWIALYQLDVGLKVLQELTNDPAVLRAALDRFKAVQSLNVLAPEQGGPPPLPPGAPPPPPPPLTPIQEISYLRRLDTTMMAFDVLARNWQGLPGRKKLVWISSALPLTYISETGGFQDKSSQFDKASKALNAANIVVYPVDPVGLCTGALGECLGLMDESLTTAIRMAAKTGGKPFYNSNDIAAGIEEAITDTDVSYTLGFYPSPSNRATTEHSVEVKVKGSGLNVRYRSTYEAEAPLIRYTKQQREGTLNAWVQEPIDPTGIPIVATIVAAPNKPGHYNVSVKVDVSALKLEEKDGRFQGSVDLAVVPDVEKKPKGLRQTIAINLSAPRYVETLQTGLVLTTQVKGVDDKGKALAKKLHVVVMDGATLKAGAVRVPFEEFDP
jgi:VWFA-related protein